MSKYVSCYFSPNRGTDDVLIGFIDRCDDTIDAAIYCLTHDSIAQALIRAKKRGVSVRILMDRLQASGRWSDDESLIQEGISLHRGGPWKTMHNKFIIGDGSSVGTGSFNWSASAEERNAENFVIIRLKYVVQSFQCEFEALWSSALR
jgi:phosphatidylserine/phosphatidylglycerophosphate/cardiolipin synthase-like enzyme